MTAMQRAYERMAMDDLNALARQDVEGYDEEATRVYVQRLIDLAGERRYAAWDFRPGWPALSPTALAGEAPGGGGRSEQMVEALRKGWRDSDWHEHALRACDRLPERNNMALMIQWLKADSRLDGPTAATYDQIAVAPRDWLQMLGWPPTQPSKPRWSNGQAIKWAARQGRAELLLWAKAGVV